MVFCWPACAQSIDLAKVYGDRNGCINRNGQEQAFDSMLLLKEGSLVTAMSACAIKSQKAGKNGAVMIDTTCEDGDGTHDVSFTIARGKKKGTFVVIDPDGNRMGQVALCPK